MRANTGTADRSASVAEAIKKIQPAHQAIGPLKMVVYGRNGQGKTHFAGSSNEKTLIVDCDEKGAETLRNRPNVDVYPVEKWQDLEGVFWFLKSSDHQYKVVALDTITMLATVAMKWVLGEVRSRDPMADPLIPEQRQWNKVTQALDNVIINWRNLPMHVLFLAQERTFETDDESIPTEVGPALSPAAYRTLMAAVGTVGRIYVQETTKDDKRVLSRRMLLGPHPKYASKTRIAGVPRILANPTLAKLLEIRSAKGEEAPETLE